MFSIAKNSCILYTAHELQHPSIEQFAALTETQALHLPLEWHQPFRDEEAIEHVFNGLDAFSNIMYGSLMHAEAFMSLVEERGYAAKKAIQQRLNITKDQETSDFLEKKGIPAIQSTQSGKAIESIEMLIRLKRLHPTLYPSVQGYYEEFPALMHELGASCSEFPVIEFTGPNKEELEDYRLSVRANKPIAVFFHAPNAVIRTLTAFPDLDLKKCQLIAMNDRTAQKMKQEGLQVHWMGNGQWHPEEIRQLKN